MADEKLTQKTANTDPQATDMLWLEDDPGGTPLSQNITVQDLMEFLTTVAETALAAADSLVVFDDDGDHFAEITFPNFMATIEDALSELTTRPAQSDTLMVIDDGVAKYVQKRNLQVRYIALAIGSEGTSLATGDRQVWFKVPADLAGLDLVSVEGDVVTAPTGAALTGAVRNVTQAADMATWSIDAGETSTDAAATAPAIDTDEDDLADGDIIAIDIDQVGSTEPGEYLVVTLGFA